MDDDKGRKTAADLYKELRENDEIQGAIDEKDAERLQKAFSDIVGKQHADELGKVFDAARGILAQAEQSIKDMVDSLPPEVKERLQEYRELMPYLDEELKNPKYEGKDIVDLGAEAELDENGDMLPSSLFVQAMNAARAARDAQGDAEQLPAIDYKPFSSQIAFNIDKSVERVFNAEWTKKALSGGIDLFVRDPGSGTYSKKTRDIPGQLSFIPLSYEKAGKEEITLFYDLEYDMQKLKDLGLPPDTTEEDFLLLTFIADAFTAKNTIITPTQLYTQFTGTKPNERQLNDFVNSLMKLAGTMVRLDDREVMKSRGKTKFSEYYGQLAPIEFLNKRYVVNGAVASSLIQINNFPRVLSVGRETGQYTTIPKSLLYVRKYKTSKGKKLPGAMQRRTPRFYKALVYLIKTIAQIKNPTTPRVNKIIYDTYYEAVGAETRREKQLSRDLLFVILDHFVYENWITSYVEETTQSTGKAGLKFTWDATAEKIERKRNSLPQQNKAQQNKKKSRPPRKKSG